MGNKDGLLTAVSYYGQNEVLNFKGGYFSFAFGNEIALKLDNSNEYFILNCDEDLWEEVINKLKKTKNEKELIKFWKEKRKDHEISCWSGDFKKLKC